jgi:hypothetical protein
MELLTLLKRPSAFLPLVMSAGAFCGGSFWLFAAAPYEVARTAAIAGFGDIASHY